MDAAKRHDLTAKLSALVGEIAAGVQEQILAPGPARERAEALHAEEGVGDTFEVWSDLLARRAAVLWALKSVYVRVLEDRDLIQPKRILDTESQQLFARLAPDLGETAYLKWVYRDLATPESGLAELFTPQPAEVVLPSDALSRKLLSFWRHQDPDTGELDWTFEAERFDGRLMGDLYQDLDPVVKDRYALLQTPDFVLDFILDETLTPAIAEWDADTVRVLDPACGSGHFLLAAFRRLVGRMREEHPDRPVAEIVRDVMGRVVGIDLNDYAGALARARLLMTAVEMLGGDDLSAARDLHPQIFWADALEQVEGGHGELELEPERTRAGMTPDEVRKALKPVLRKGFHVVVGNPPYITEKDKTKKAYHREKVGKRRRYQSAYREYSLASPFTERAFQLATNGGWVGYITGNNFMKRSFGAALIEEVLAKWDLTKVVDTSGAYIPGHGTPTVILVGRRQKPASEKITAVLGKRSEPSIPGDAAQGMVWTSIVRGHREPGYEDEFVSVAKLPRKTMCEHPWSLQGGGAVQMKAALEEAGQKRLDEVASDIGTGAVTREDDVYFVGTDAALRRGVPRNAIRSTVLGVQIRDWSLDDSLAAIWPYDADSLEAVRGEAGEACKRALWLWRTRLRERSAYGKTQLEHGLTWYEYSMFFEDRYRIPNSIAFAFVATHNHFVLDRGGKVFNRSAPIIKLPEGATEEDHLALLGLLNSSTGCFWMKQVSHDKGGGTDKGSFQANPAKIAYEFSATQLKQFPVPEVNRELRQCTVKLAGLATRLGEERGQALDEALRVWSEASSADRPPLNLVLRDTKDRERRLTERLIFIQEELDWIGYIVFGLTGDTDLLTSDGMERDAGVALGSRPFEMRRARAGAKAGLDGQPLTPALSTDADESLKEVWERRIQAIGATNEIAMLEVGDYKRRWVVTPKSLGGAVLTFEHRSEWALEAWLADRMEDWAKAHDRAFTVRELAAGLQDDDRVQAVAELLTGRRDFDLGRELATRLAGEAIPNNKHHVYKPSGLKKRAAWEQTWADQHREDAGEAVTPKVPPKYKSSDFLRGGYWSHRGKLDVPKERFVAFTEVPGAEGDETLYGWAGWTPRKRAGVLLELDEDLVDRGVDLEDRYGVLYGAQFLMPYVAWESREAADEFRSILEMELGTDGVTEDMLARWADQHPAPGAARKKSRKRT